MKIVSKMLIDRIEKDLLSIYNIGLSNTHHHTQFLLPNLENQLLKDYIRTSTTPFQIYWLLKKI